MVLGCLSVAGHQVRTETPGGTCLRGLPKAPSVPGPLGVGVRRGDISPLDPPGDRSKRTHGVSGFAVNGGRCQHPTHRPGSRSTPRTKGVSSRVPVGPVDTCKRAGRNHKTDDLTNGSPLLRTPETAPSPPRSDQQGANDQIIRG